MAGQSGAAGHLTSATGRGGAKSAVYKDVPDGEMVTGIPARPHREWLQANADLQRLDQLRERLGRLEEAVGSRESGRGGRTMIDIERILDVLPHRYPFLLVDRVLELDSTRVLGTQERDLQRVALRRPLPAEEGDAGGADRRGDGAGRRRA